MNATLLLDGGTGSELRRRGVPFRESCFSAAANLTDQDVLVSIHRDYIRAGADIITANTFATSRFVLEAAGLAERFEDINRSALAAAKYAAADADRPIQVAASLSCCPPLLNPAAWPDADTELRGLTELAEFFAGHDVDLILLEMLQHPEHAALACRAARQSGLPFWAGISCRADPRKPTRLVSFNEPAANFEAVLEAALPYAPQGIAIMHSPIDAVLPALYALRRHFSGPVGAYAEIPYPEDPAATSAERISPGAYAEQARTWLDLDLLGGCCGTTPAHIAALRRLLDTQAG